MSSTHIKQGVGGRPDRQNPGAPWPASIVELETNKINVSKTEVDRAALEGHQRLSPGLHMDGHIHEYTHIKNAPRCSPQSAWFL